MRHCEECFKILSRTETRLCNWCRRKIEREKFLKNIAGSMDKYHMTTTGSEAVDLAAAPYRG